MAVPARVQFRERQRLRAADLQAEQAYLLGVAGRHATTAHTWGVVRGLDVTATATTATIDPGVAIDGYGREIALFESIDLDLTPPIDGVHVYIFYCERPADGCGAAPAPRMCQYGGVLAASDEWLAPADDPSIGDALAAGPVPDAPPWPVLLGIIRNTVNGPIVDDSSVRFAGLRAARVTAGSGRATMQLGAETAADKYLFDVSIDDGTGTLQHRLAIDRDGNPNFWNDLEIIGPDFQTPPMPSMIQGVFLQARIKTAGTRWRSVLSGGTLTVQFLTRQGQLSTFQLPAASRTMTQLKSRIKTFNKASALGALSYLGKKIAVPRGSTPPTPFLDDTLQAVQPSDGSLTFAPNDDASPASCGCNQSDEGGALPEGFLFQPGTAKLSALEREIACTKLVDANKQPYQEYRVSGGLKQDGDFTRHISIGGYEPTDFTDSNGNDYPDLTGPHFQPWLTLHGSGLVEIMSRGQTDTSGQFFKMLKARRVTLAPIKPDPRDPLFNYLLVLSFIKGVTSSSASVLGITFKLPTLVESNNPWNYDVVLTNTGGTETLTQPPATMPETLSVGSMVTASTIPIPGGTSIAPGASVTIAVAHGAADITIPSNATKLTIDVGLAMTAGSFKVGGQGSAQVEVVQTPDGTLTTGAVAQNTAFTIALAVRNSSSQDLVVTAISVDVPAANPPWNDPAALAAPTPVAAGTTTAPISLTSNSQPTAPASPATVVITATIQYTWTGATDLTGAALTGTTTATLSVNV